MRMHLSSCVSYLQRLKTQIEFLWLIMEFQRNKLKVNKIPKSSLAFYIKLYCKEKGSSKTKYQSNLIEATKSWLSLSDFEKQQVTAKYKELEHTLKLKCIGQLQNAEPFMKIKDSSNCRLLNVSLNTELEMHNKENSVHSDTEQGNQIEDQEDIILLGSEQLITVADAGPNRDHEEYNETIIEPFAANKHPPRIFLEEPLPPTLMTGKDLFNILHSSDEASNVFWTSLPRLERNQYNRAVSLLKRDYIIKFKEYLDCLTQKELFDYHNKTIF